MGQKNVLAFLAFFVVLNVFSQEWKTHRNAMLECRADFLGEPTITTKKEQSEVGELDVQMLSYSCKDQTYMSVIKTNYPKGTLIKPKTVLDKAVKGATSSVNGKLIQDKGDVFNGYPVRKIKIEAKGIALFINIYAVEESIYITQVVCAKDNEDLLLIEKFLNSFDIIKVNKD
ncbi:MAG: hypothetical protein HRT67_13050 [Flavobacteriaceae bacterium]|nr:hypothetical protein [Flavobacteriaceae bacterium]